MAALFDKTRARALISACSILTAGTCSPVAPNGRRPRMSAMRSEVRGWLRKYGKAPLSLSRAATWSLSNIDAKPSGAKPASPMTPKPTRSASRSMSREKLS